MAINKFFIRYKFTDAKLNVVLQDLKRKTDELIDYTLSIDWGNLGLYDTDKSDILTLKWDEDDSNPRDFKFKVNKGDRTLDLSGNLTTESASILNQDYTTDASVIFGGLTINGDSNLDGAVTINESGEDKDFRVEGLDYTYLFFTDASTNRIGINENAPKALFHIRHGTCTDYVGVYGDVALLLEGTTSVTLQLQGSTNAAANIVFADDDYNPCAGRIQYDFNTDEMNFGIGTNILVYFKTTGAVFTQDEMEIDSTSYAAFIANAHNADAYFSLEEDEALKWTMGFDYSDSRKFQISEGVPGTDVRFEIEPNGLINCYLNLAIRSTLGIRFYDNGNYVGFRAPALSADQTWVLPSADGSANEALGTDGSGTLLWRTHDELAGFVSGEHFLQSAITEVGTIATGLWQGTAIADTYIASAATWNAKQAGDTALTNLSSVATTANRYLRITGVDTFDERTYANVLSDIGGAGSGANSDITSMSGITGTIATPTNLANKTAGAWTKSIGSGGDYADWATMIVDMPDLIAHAVTVTIEIGTTLTEICSLANKQGLTTSSLITIQVERYYPTTTHAPTADSATATTLRDAELAAAAFGNDYFNGCWIIIVDGTGTDNLFVPITDYVDATGDVVVAAWSGTQPDNTSKYQIVGALVDGGGVRADCFNISYNDCPVVFNGVGIQDADAYGVRLVVNKSIKFNYCCIEGCDICGCIIAGGNEVFFVESAFVNNNTDNTADGAGILVNPAQYLYINRTAFSDNNQQGVLMMGNAYAEMATNFGDGNGNWGTYCKFSSQAYIRGTECSGSGGNHSDEGTADAAADDQAAAYT